MECDTELRAALAKIDSALAKKPAMEGHIFSAAARHLCQVRDDLTAQHATGANPQLRKQLGHLNAVISVVLAGHFPLGEVPWNELELARGWLADLAEERRAV